MDFEINWMPKSQTEWLSLARRAYVFTKRLDLWRVTIEKNSNGKYQVFTNWNSCSCKPGDTITQAFINAEELIIENQGKPKVSCEYKRPEVEINS